MFRPGYFRHMADRRLAFRRFRAGNLESEVRYILDRHKNDEFYEFRDVKESIDHIIHMEETSSGGNKNVRNDIVKILENVKKEIPNKYPEIYEVKHTIDPLIKYVGNSKPEYDAYLLDNHGRRFLVCGKMGRMDDFKSRLRSLDNIPEGKQYTQALDDLLSNYEVFRVSDSEVGTLKSRGVLETDNGSYYLANENGRAINIYKGKIL